MDLGIPHLKEPPNFQPFPTYIPDFHHISTIFLYFSTICLHFFTLLPPPPTAPGHARCLALGRLSCLLRHPGGRDATYSGSDASRAGVLGGSQRVSPTDLPRFARKAMNLRFFFYFFFAGYLSKSKKKTRKR